MFYEVKRMKKLFFTFVIFFTIYFLFTTHYYKQSSIELEKDNSEIVDVGKEKEEKKEVESSELNKENIIKDTKDDPVFIQNNDSNDSVPNKNNMEDDNVSNTDVIDDNSKKDINEKEKNSEGAKKDGIEQVPNQQLKKLTIWEELGISEYDYYNKPMYSWEKIDFKSMNECLEYGDNYKPYLDGEVLYNCHDVLSTSGKFLGVMFDTEKLN